MRSALSRLALTELAFRACLLELLVRGLGVKNSLAIQLGRSPTRRLNIPRMCFAGTSEACASVCVTAQFVGTNAIGVALVMGIATLIKWKAEWPIEYNMFLELTFRSTVCHLSLPRFPIATSAPATG